MRPERGDVVPSDDPFKLGEDRRRPWLICSNTSHPFDDEQYVAVAVTTREYGDSLALEPDVREVGGVPRDSFVSPRAVHSPRIEDLSPGRGGWPTRSSTGGRPLETYLR